MTSSPPDKDFFKSIGIFQNFSPDAVKKLASQAEFLGAKTGQAIFAEGEPAESFYVLVTGKIRITKRMSESSERTVSVLDPGSTFGEMSLFVGQKHRIAGARAMEDATYYKIKRPIIRDLLVGSLEGTAKSYKSMMLTAFARLEQTTLELATIYQLSTLMTSGLSLKQFCQATVELLSFSIPHVDSALMYVLDDAAKSYSLTGKVGESAVSDTVRFDAPVIRFIGLKADAARAEATSVTNPDLAQGMLKGIASAKSLVLLSFLEKSGCVGFLLLMNKKEQVESHINEMALLNSLAIQISNAVKILRRDMGGGVGRKLHDGSTGAAMEESSVPSHAADPKGKLILLVDDDASIRDLLKTMLQKEGFRTESAADGQEGIRKVEMHSPDLIMLDYIMPGSGGLEVLKELQVGDAKTIPVIVMSGRRIDSQMLDMIQQESNVKEFMAKPVKRAVLVSMLHRILKTRPPEIESRPDGGPLSSSW